MEDPTSHEIRIRFGASINPFHHSLSNYQIGILKAMKTYDANTAQNVCQSPIYRKIEEIYSAYDLNQPPEKRENSPTFDPEKDLNQQQKKDGSPSSSATISV